MPGTLTTRCNVSSYLLTVISQLKVFNWRAQLSKPCFRSTRVFCQPVCSAIMDVIIPIVIGGIAGDLVGRACERRKSRKSKPRDDRRETYSSSRTSPGTYRTAEQPYSYAAESLERSTPNYDTYLGRQPPRGNTSPLDYPFPPPFVPLAYAYRSQHCQNCHQEHRASEPCFTNYDAFQTLRSRRLWCSRCFATYDQASTGTSWWKCKFPGCTHSVNLMRFGSPYEATKFRGDDYCAIHTGMLAEQRYMSEKWNKSDQFSNRGLITAGPTARPYLLTDGYGAT